MTTKPSHFEEINHSMSPSTINVTEPHSASPSHTSVTFGCIGLDWARFNIPPNTFQVILETVGWLWHQPGL